MPSRSKAPLIYYASADQGILFSTFDEAFQKVSSPAPAGEGLPNSFFLASHPTRPVLYSVDLSAGMVSALAVAPDGALTEMNRMESKGEAPCHLAVDPLGRFVVVANYQGGVSLFPLRPDGGLTSATSVYKSSGSGPNPNQAGPHPHGIALAPEQDLAYVADLGTDHIYAVSVKGNPLELAPVDGLTTTVRPGSGPRHIVIHPEGNSAIVVNELNNTVTSFLRDPKTGQLREVDSAPTLPPEFKGESWTAEIGYHPRADVCYASNRGRDTLTIFAIDRRTGKLRPRQSMESGGKKPQHFAFDSAGRTLFVANTDSNVVSMHRINQETGLPSEKLRDIPVSKPMCVLIAALK